MCTRGLDRTCAAGACSRCNAVLRGMNVMRLFRRFTTSACPQSARASLALGLLGPATAMLGALAALSVPGSALAVAGRAGSGHSGPAVATASPSSATPGTPVQFEVTCTTIDASSATLSATPLGLSSSIAMTKMSDNGIFDVTVTLPRGIQPGTYNVDIRCSDGSSGTATLQVTALPAAGGAQTGGGSTSTQTDTGLTDLGLGMIAAGAVTGGIALRRRSSGPRA